MVTVTMAVSGAVLVKAGRNVLSGISGGTLLVGSGADYAVEHFIAQAESYVNAVTRKNWTDVYTTLNLDTRKILEEAVSNLAAIYAISYDMSGYTSRIEAENMINILWARFNQCIELLKDQKTVTFLEGS